MPKRLRLSIGGKRIKRARVSHRYTGGRSRTERAFGIEKKFYDQKLVGATLTAPTDSAAGEHNPSTAIMLNTVPQGTKENERDGRQIVMKSVQVKGIFNVPAVVDATAATVSGVAFVALVLDKQTNGVQLDSEDVFTNPSANAFNCISPFRNLKFVKRFQVLASKTIVLPQPEMVHDGINIEIGGYTVPFNMYVKLKDILTTFSAATENVLNTVDNSIQLVAFVNNVNIGVVMTYHSRLRFVG